MGSKCSGSYADIFMGGFERQHIYPRINGNHRCYTRFKDDVFLVWTYGEASLLQFFNEINSVHPSIKFECHHSRSKINFLDCMVHIDPEGNLSTSLYSKPTDRNAYLHHRSYPPPNQVRNIPYGQFLRVKKLCSNQEDATEGMTQLAEKFVNRGYPRELIKEQQQRTDSVDRNQLLIDKGQKKSSKTPFTTTYNRHHPPYGKSSTHTGISYTPTERTRTLSAKNQLSPSGEIVIFERS